MRKPNIKKVKSLASRQGCIFVRENCILDLELKKICDSLLKDGYFKSKERSHTNIKYVLM